MLSIKIKRNKLGQFTKTSPWTEKFSRFVPATFVIFGMLIFNIYPTSAYFSDTENSTENTFQAGTLNIDISGRNVSGIVNPGDATTTAITLSKSNPDNLDYQYFASSTIVGDATACDYISLAASSTAQNYSGLVKNFVSTASAPTGPVQWDFIFTVAGTVSPADLGKICNFKISYSAWQTNLPNSSQGFSDVAEMTGSIQIGTAPIAPNVPDVVLNEFLPNPGGAFGDDGDKAPYGEWVELYNNSASAIDLKNWYIRDATVSEKVNILTYNTYDFSIHASSTIIAPKGWLVVYMNKAFLNNTGTETITLYNSSDVSQDFYSYATSSVPINKSYARIPDGTGAWVDPIPTPGEPNKMEEILTSSPSQGEGGGEVVVTAQMVTETASTTEQIATTTLEIATTTAEIIMEIASTTPEIIPTENDIKDDPLGQDLQGSSFGTEGALLQEPAVMSPELEVILEVVNEPIIETPIVIEPETI